jgi:cysteine desulfurase
VSNVGVVIGLDAASGLPLHPAAREAWLAALDDGWADPARLYASSRRARQLLDGATAAVAHVLGARPDEVHWAPNGSQALYAGIRGVRLARARAGSHVVHSAVEHSAALHACAEGPATSVPVDLLGRVFLDDFVASVQTDTVLGCLIAASHEVGTVQPVAAVSAAVGVPLLVDSSQVVGHAPVPEGWSLLTASARKWGGPTVGLLAVRTGVRWVSPWQEAETAFPGSLDLPSVLAAAVALEAVVAEAEGPRLSALVDRVRAVVGALEDVEVVGDPVDRLPGIVTFTVLYVAGETLVSALDALGFAVSSGSSCTSSTLEPSHVLVAMGVSTHGSVRVSLSRWTSADDVDRFLEVLPGVISQLRAAG